MLLQEVVVTERLAAVVTWDLFFVAASLSMRLQVLSRLAGF